MDNFKSETYKVKWMELHNQKAEIQKKKPTMLNENKIDVLSSLMTGCKVGFGLNDAKIKKSIKFLRQYTGVPSVRYGNLPDGYKVNTVLNDKMIIIYAEKEDKIIFKEHI